jgi:hypothetical protein
MLSIEQSDQGEVSWASIVAGFFSSRLSQQQR